MRLEKLRVKYSKEITAYKLLGIPLALWAIFFVFALFRAFFISLTDWNLLREASFVGLDNYIEILSDKETLQVFINTITWTLFIAVGQNVIGLFMAYMLNEIPRGEAFFRTTLYWPVLVSLVVGAEMIKYIFNPSPFGLMNSLLIKLGMEPMAWYQDPQMALISLAIFPMFTGFGIKMIIYLAGIKGIPYSIYEAAEIDGAKAYQQFARITLPLIKPIVILNFVMSTIEGFRVLAPMQLVTNGGPINSTETVVLSIYKQGFIKNNMGYASALAFILFAIILVISAVQLRLQGEDTSYE